MLDRDLAARVPSVEVPVYSMHGSLDLTCARQVARDYFAALDMPLKAFHTFEDAARSPFFEDPARCCAILRDDVLQGRRTLADP